MRQPAAAGSDIDQVHAPGQRFQKSKSRVHPPKQIRQRLVGDIKPPLSRF